MAGNNPRQAVQAFFKPLQHVLSCFTDAVITHKGDYKVNGGPYALTVGTGHRTDKFKLPGSDFHFSVLMNYTIVNATADRGPYKVKSTAYFYSLEEDGGKEILTYQWHPTKTCMFPHIHLGSSSKLGSKTLNKLHIPTGRIALEQVLRLAVEELGVKPIKTGWSDILCKAQGGFEKWRTWHYLPPPTTPE